MLWSCSKENKNTSLSPNLPSTPYAYKTGSNDKISVIHFTANIVGINPASVTLPTNFGATLGRVVFNDNAFTATGNIHCGSCHSGNILSTATLSAANGNSNISPNTIQRNSFGSDGSRMHPEVGLLNINTVISRMSASAFYPKLFKDAYGTSDITAERVSDALAQYMVAMSAASPEELANDPKFSNPFK